MNTHVPVNMHMHILTFISYIVNMHITYIANGLDSEAIITTTWPLVSRPGKCSSPRENMSQEINNFQSWLTSILLFFKKNWSYRWVHRVEKYLIPTRLLLSLPYSFEKLWFLVCFSGELHFLSFGRLSSRNFSLMKNKQKEALTERHTGIVHCEETVKE